ncbi:MAG: DinB family protein [Ignavibacteria bacterium]|nr:DinB family protein [Ignavibacteria bacterium]
MANQISKQFAEQFEAMVDWVNGYIDPLTDDELKMEIAPGKNHGVWILGHLIASDDDFSVFMGKGDLLFPDYYEMFGQGSKLQPVENYPPIPLLREQWKTIIEKNRKIYSELQDQELNEPHGRMENPEKDFFKTKQRIIFYWQLHQMYHAGQLSIILSKVGKALY